MRHAEHLEITLHETVFARSAMLHDVCIVKLHLALADHNRKIGLIDLRTLILRDHDPHGILLSICCERPLAISCKNLIHIEFRSVNTRSGELTASARHLPFRGVASIYYCNIFHLLKEIICTFLSLDLGIGIASVTV